MGHKGESKRKVGKKKVKSMPAEPATHNISTLLKAVEILPGKSQAAGRVIAATKENVKTSSGGKIKLKKD